MRTLIVLNVAALLFGRGALAAEKKVKIENLPPAVQKTVKQEIQNATLVGLSSEVEKGKTVYELETKKPNGQTRDLMIDTAGAIFSVEEEVGLESIPAAAKSAIEKAAKGGRVTRVETVTEGKVVTYEAAITKSGKKSSITVKSDGGIVN